MGEGGFGPPKSETTDLQRLYKWRSKPGSHYDVTFGDFDSPIYWTSGALFFLRLQILHGRGDMPPQHFNVLVNVEALSDLQCGMTEGFGDGEEVSCLIPEDGSAGVAEPVAIDGRNASGLL